MSPRSDYELMAQAIVEVLDEKRKRDGYLSMKLEEIYQRCRFELHAIRLLTPTLAVAR